MKLTPVKTFNDGSVVEYQSFYDAEECVEWVKANHDINCTDGKWSMQVVWGELPDPV